ncbi:MAG TPA: ABC transporter [Nocardioides bacterium]|nr:ABC transporter [Nocardioides sp.]
MNELTATEPTAAEQARNVALAVQNVSKTYGATRALDGVSLEVTTGAIHGLMGGNGSGKSTLIKVLAGVVTPDEGKLSLKGEWIDARSQTPARAKSSGLHFVHQQNSTFPDLTVAENSALGRGFESTLVKSINWNAQKARARKVLDRFEIDVAADTHLARLSPAAQMMVAIARALQDQDDTDERGVLVLDEPTASLPKHEVDVLLTALRSYAAAGQTIIYISHRLEEVTAITDEVTVLRNGSVASRLTGAEISHDTLVAGITGSMSSPPVGGARRDAVASPLRHGVDAQEAALTLSRRTPTGLHDETLLVRAGEIVGLAGLLGSGRSRMLKQIFGAAPRDDFDVTVGSGTVPSSDMRTAMKQGVAFVPENRLREAALPELSIAENLSITSLSEHSRAGWIRPSRERKAAKRLIQEFRVRAPSTSAPLTALSGGNQQKVILARWLQRRPDVLLLDEPTQGVDIGARNEIHELVRTAAAAGTAVLVVSSDFGELAALAQRAVVISGGEIVDSVDGPLTEDILNDIVYAQEKAL